jgi:tRNA pseudouridine55 synthase
MIVAVGREYTKQLDRFLKLDKTYGAIATLGMSSTTLDSEGELTKNSDDVPSEENVLEAISKMVGKQMQMPPDFSAKKINGKKAYELARAGKEVRLEPKAVEIYQAKLLKYEYPEVEFEVKVSSGTYVRTLVHELGKTLEVGAYMSGLVRTSIDNYLLDNAIKLDDIKHSEDLEKAKIT